MKQGNVNLLKEQQATLNRPRYRYSLAARIFFFKMDLLAGRRTTLSKAKLLEILASIPYREWEIRQYARLTRGYRKQALVQQARRIMIWGREAQDNEYMHLLVINEKMKADKIRDAWYLYQPMPFFIVLTYILLSKTLAFFNIRRAFLFNAEFEDHAEHIYALFVKDHPEWEKQRVQNALVKEYTDADAWANVFRRIGLDERDHRNSSFQFSGKPEAVVKYEGMQTVQQQ